MLLTCRKGLVNSKSPAGGEELFKRKAGCRADFGKFGLMLEPCLSDWGIPFACGQPIATGSLLAGSVSWKPIWFSGRLLDLEWRKGLFYLRTAGGYAALGLPGEVETAALISWWLVRLLYIHSKGFSFPGLWKVDLSGGGLRTGDQMLGWSNNNRGDI